MTYIVQHSTYDAARPWIVVHTKRSFNKVVGHYCSRAQAVRRARDLNKWEESCRDFFAYRRAARS